MQNYCLTDNHKNQAKNGCLSGPDLIGYLVRLVSPLAKGKCRGSHKPFRFAFLFSLKNLSPQKERGKGLLYLTLSECRGSDTPARYELGGMTPAFLGCFL